MRDEVVKYCETISTESHLGITEIIKMLGIGKGKYYQWRLRLGTENNHNGKQPKQHWLTPEKRQSIIDFARSYISTNQYYLHDDYRRIPYMGIDANKFACSPATVYRVLSKSGLLSKWKGKRHSSKGTGYRQPNEAHKEWHTNIKSERQCVIINRGDTERNKPDSCTSRT